jgi:hypothetical protein
LPRGQFGLYGLQTPTKAWHHIPFWHVIFPGPQAHVAAAARSVSHGDNGFRICPFAWANPADIPIASTTTAKVLSIVPSPDLLEMATEMAASFATPKCSHILRRNAVPN